MEDNKNIGTASQQQEQQESNLLSVKFIYTSLVLYWKWFALSLIICLGCSILYLRYKTPTFSVSTTILIKEDQQQGRRSTNQMLSNMSELGFMTNTQGFDNEVELLKSRILATDAVKDLKLYVQYFMKGKVKDQIVYKNQPINVDIDINHRDTLNTVIKVNITREDNKYDVIVNYKPNPKAKYELEIAKQGISLPAVIRTKVGVITLTTNGKYTAGLKDGKTLIAKIYNPKDVGEIYASRLEVAPTSKTTTIASLTLIDEIPDRGIDYINQLAFCYNRQANVDKNEIAVRTEQFINDRLQKIDAELGNTDGAIEQFKKANNVLDFHATSTQSLTQTTTYDKEMAEAQAQLMLLSSINDYMNQSSNRYQTIPSNVGLTDAAATALINQYNSSVLERNKLLRTASDKSPNVQALTAQLDELTASIRSAILQAQRNQTILANSVQQQFHKYNDRITQTPEQERVLTQIGREQEVKSSLYIMLLQKREENSISLAATANKGKLVDEPALIGKVQPKGIMVLLIAIILGLGIPMGIIILLEVLRFRIEGHEDVAKLTSLPIIADVAIASDSAKQRADIVVHENRNDQMEEIFRSMRTNLQFIMKPEDKVIMFTSSTSGEGKTFCAANLAVSFALLGKKVILIGLDIRRPRLNSLFELKDKTHGITPLLVKDNITWEDIQGQLVDSEVNNNLDLLMAGPIAPNPAELVARKSLDDIFAILRQKYDYIIVDTAPVGLVTDTFSIGRVCDATIYTCRADYTEKAAFPMINQWAAEKKMPNMSIIINGIDMSKKKYGYAYGYGKYGKYGRYGKYGYNSSYGYGNYSSSHYGNANDTSIKK